MFKMDKFRGPTLVGDTKLGSMVKDWIIWEKRAEGWIWIGKYSVMMASAISAPF